MGVHQLFSRKAVTDKVDGALAIFVNTTFTFNKNNGKVNKMKDCRRKLKDVEVDSVERYGFERGTLKDTISEKVLLFTRSLSLMIFDGRLEITLLMAYIPLQHLIGILGIYLKHRYIHPFYRMYTPLCIIPR